MRKEEVEGRFFQFWEWYKETHPQVIRYGGEISMGYFKTVISLKGEALRGKKGKENIELLLRSFNYEFQTQEGKKRKIH
jgi:hypothetical protein